MPWIIHWIKSIIHFLAFDFKFLLYWYMLHRLWKHKAQAIDSCWEPAKRRWCVRKCPYWVWQVSWYQQELAAGTSYRLYSESLLCSCKSSGTSTSAVVVVSPLIPLMQDPSVQAYCQRCEGGVYFRKTPLQTHAQPRNTVLQVNHFQQLSSVGDITSLSHLLSVSLPIISSILYTDPSFT